MKEAESSVNERLDCLGRDEIRVWQKSRSWSGWMAKSRTIKQSGNDWNGTENRYVID